jgi:hypothetical protein
MIRTAGSACPDTFHPAIVNFLTIRFPHGQIMLSRGRIPVQRTSVPYRRRVAAAGRQLRRLRKRLGLSMRDVEKASRGLAMRQGSHRLIIAPSSLCHIETRCLIPSVHRLYALARIYSCDVRRLLGFYGLRS